MKIRKIIFLFAAFFIPGWFLAQQSKYIDSLFKVLDTCKNNKLKADILRELCYEFTYVDVKKAYAFGEQSINLSNQSNYHHGVIEANNALSIIDKNNGEYSKAFLRLKSALLLCEEHHDSASLSRTLLNIGDVYSHLQNYEKAIEDYEKAYEINWKLRDTLRSITNLSRIANRHMDIGNFRNDTAHIRLAINYYNDALYLAQKVGDKRKITLMHVNLADAHNILAEKNQSRLTMQKAIDYSMKSIRLAKLYNFPDMEGISLLNIGESYEKLGNISLAISYYMSALKIYADIGNLNWELNCHTYLAKAYFRLQQFQKTIHHSTLAINLALKNKIKKALVDNYLLLANSHRALNDYSTAMNYYQIYNNHKDSLQLEQNALTTARLQTELEMELKNKEIELLRRNAEIQEEKIKAQTSQRNFLIGIIVLTLVLLAFVLYRYFENQKIQRSIIKAKELAEQAKLMQEQFLANTSHEIRTPLNGIIGMTELLKSSKLDSRQTEFLNAIYDSSQNLLVIINDLLDLSKINAGKMSFESHPFSLHSLFKTIALSVQPRIAEKHLDFDIDIDKEIPSVLNGDSTRLNQIISNLINNAIKFTDRGKISIHAKLISLAQNRAKIRIAISDTGIGIPEDKLTAIFSSFSQIDSGQNKKYGGTGLGLSIVKHLVESQGGKITVNSKVHAGSEFSFELEFEIPEVHQSNGIRHQENHTKLPDDKVVFIIDDNKINIQVAELMLQKWGLKTNSATNPKDALNFLIHTKVDLILMDISMPEMDGFELTQAIRSLKENPNTNVPIIAMTATALPGYKKKCIEGGMTDYISKPFQPEELKNLLAKYLIQNNPGNQLANELKLSTGFDNDSLIEIINSYLTEMPVYVAELRDFMHKNNMEGFSKQAHKMKSPAALMGASELAQLLEKIEKTNYHNHPQANPQSDFTSVEQLCEKSFSDLKAVLNHLSLS